MGVVKAKASVKGRNAFHTGFVTIISNRTFAKENPLCYNVGEGVPAKISLARKRRRCSYDDAFFADVLRSVHA